MLALHPRTLDFDSVAAYGNVEFVWTYARDKGSNDEVASCLVHIDRKLPRIPGRYVLIMQYRSRAGLARARA